MNMVEYTVSMVIALLSVQIINTGWKHFVLWKNDEERKKRRRAKKHNRQLKKELRKAGATKEEIGD